MSAVYTIGDMGIEKERIKAAVLDTFGDITDWLDDDGSMNARTRSYLLRLCNALLIDIN